MAFFRILTLVVMEALTKYLEQVIDCTKSCFSIFMFLLGLFVPRLLLMLVSLKATLFFLKFSYVVKFLTCIVIGTMFLLLILKRLFRFAWLLMMFLFF